MVYLLIGYFSDHRGQCILNNLEGCWQQNLDNRHKSGHSNEHSVDDVNTANSKNWWEVREKKGRNTTVG